MIRLNKIICLLCVIITIVIGIIGGYYFSKKNDNSKNNVISGAENKTNSENKEYSPKGQASKQNNIKVKHIGKEIRAELTAYCNCKICSEEWGAKTAMQTQNRVGVVAAPKDISLGSKIYIPELKYYKKDGIFDVEDRGGEVKVKDDGTHIIDVWLSSHEQVIKFGRKKNIKIYLINK